MKYPTAILLVSTLLGLRLCAADSPSAPQQAPTPEKPKYSIENCVTSLDLTKTEKTKAGYQFWFADRNFADGQTLKLSVVGPEMATHAPHHHIEDEFFFIIEGRAEFFLDGKRKEVGPMTTLYCPSMMEHGIRNAGKTELKYLVVKKIPQK